MRVDNRNIIGITTLALMSVLMLFSCFEVFGSNEPYPPSTIINLSLDVFGIIICTIIFASTLLDQHINPSTIIFMCILTLEELLLFWNIESWISDGNPDKLHFIKITNYYTYGFQQIILVAFWMYLRELYSEHHTKIRRMSILIYVLFAFGMILIVTNPWTDLLFTIDPDTGIYDRGKGFALSYISPYLSMAICAICILKYERNLRRKTALLAYILVPLVGAIVQSIYSEVSLQVVFLMFAIVFMYTNIYIERSAELIANETKMSEQRASVMVSQIQPHFMYNALTSIMNIKGNPMDTRDAIADFGKYMRGNLDSITQVNPIPITREIEQLESYINLRKIKYEDSIEVNIDIKDTGFFIPPMTVKTILGEAIRLHLDNPDFFVNISIATESDDQNHILIITDNYPTESVYRFINEDFVEGISVLATRLDTMVGGSIRNVFENGGELNTIITIPRTKEAHR